VTVIEVELAVLIVAILVLAFVFWRAARDLLGKLYDRQVAADRHAKEAGRADLRAANAAEKVAADARQLYEDVRLMQERVERHMSDPRVKRLLSER
jgi:alkylation response protein AidB-like acyl-CoA dehydrogenase